MTAEQIADALRRLATGDQDPPRPWAYLSGLGITHVDDVSGLTVRGYTDVWGFEILADGKVYRIMVQAL